MNHVSVLAAFWAGVLSFLSPCVFPLVPGYLSYITGTTIASPQLSRWRPTLHAVCFVLGFAVIFSVLGAAASSAGFILSQHKLLLQRMAGLLLIAFGSVMTGVLNVPLLQRDYRTHIPNRPPAFTRSFTIGIAFGAGWSPCIGPILGSVLALAAAGSTLSHGVALLLVYSVGLGVPFIALGFLLDTATPLFRKLNRYTGVISVIGGIVLIATGLLILSGKLAVLATYGAFLS